MRAVLAIVLAMMGLLAAGCGGAPKYVPVSGKVTIDGQPLANVHVSFQPVASGGGEPGPGSYGTTDAEGKYLLTVALTQMNKVDGAVPGKHRVSITTPSKSSSDEIQAEPLPARYNAATELSFEVPAAGSSQADFALTR